LRKFKFICYIILLALFSCSGTKSINDKIPKTAFLIQKDSYKNWFDVKWINNHQNMAYITIYDGITGNVIIESKFAKICPVDELKFIENLKNEIDFFDGENIQLKDNCYLMQQ